jgi:nicotinate-nucleotide adenylyltransferase
MGGTFDPPHLGHIKIAESFLNSGIIGRLLVIPVYVPPHKVNALTPYQVRLEMTRAAFSGMKNVDVSDLESRLTTPSYSYNTILHLKKNLPETDLYLCIGSDSLVIFNTWYKYRELLEHCRLIVAERPGYTRDKLPDWMECKVQYVKHDPVDVSATDVRKITRQEKYVTGLILPEVQDIIDREGLYSG